MSSILWVLVQKSLEKALYRPGWCLALGRGLHWAKEWIASIHPTLQTRGPFPLLVSRLLPTSSPGTWKQWSWPDKPDRAAGLREQQGQGVSHILNRARQLDYIRFPGEGEPTSNPDSLPRWMLPGWWIQWNELCMLTPCKFPSEKPGKVQSGDDHSDAPTSTNVMDSLEPLSLLKTH